MGRPSLTNLPPEVPTTDAPTSVVCEHPNRGPEGGPRRDWTDPVGTARPQPGLRGGWKRREAAPSQPLSHAPPPGLVFYDTKVTVMNRVLNATVQRTADHAAPEIALDPLEIVGGKIRYMDQKRHVKEASRRRERRAPGTAPPSPGCSVIVPSHPNAGFWLHSPS